MKITFSSSLNHLGITAGDLLDSGPGFSSELALTFSAITRESFRTKRSLFEPPDSIISGHEHLFSHVNWHRDS